MKAFFFGFILGIASTTVGFSGLAPILDSGVRSIQQSTINLTENTHKNYEIR
jgi:hypothetical protein